MMMVSAIGRPSCERSWGTRSGTARHRISAGHLDIIPFVIVTAFAEQPVRYDMVNVQLV